jgi:nucleoside-diphosphate-sugar epimerase
MKLFVFGLSYTALAFVHSQPAQWSRVSGTVRFADKARDLQREGIQAYPLMEEFDASGLVADIGSADALLVSAPPSADGDPCLGRFREAIASADNLRWIGYLSTTGIYGDHDGAWIDEQTPPTPQSPRSVERLAAERDWQAFGRDTGKPVQVFRLSGIYGPGRNPLMNLARGTAHRIVKPSQVFNRIHVDDIAAMLWASMQKSRQGAIYNVADDEPAPPQDVVAYAAHLAGIEPPPEIPFETADLSPMARSFYSENKRVSNRLIKEELGVQLIYPTYREGLQALYQAGEYSRVA